MTRLAGYCDRASVRPGETLAFHVAADAPALATPTFVRLICGDANPDGPGFQERPVDIELPTACAVGPQPSRLGSYLRAPAAMLRDWPALTFTVLLQPTTPDGGAQAIFALGGDGRASGIAVGLHDGRVELHVGADARFRLIAPRRVEAGRWYCLTAALVPEEGRAWLAVFDAASDGCVASAVGTFPACRAADLVPERAVLTLAALYDAATGLAHAHYNGRLEAPRLHARALDGAAAREAATVPVDRLGHAVLAAWDFSRGIDTCVAQDLGPHALHGTLVNLPTRGVRGHAWDGREYCWRHAPMQYAAIHFHDDDLADIGWPVTLEVTLPRSLASGVYALRLECGEHVERIPVFVRPGTDAPHADTVFLAPTYSYLAYGNERGPFQCAFPEFLVGRAVCLSPEELYLQDHPEFGLSLYDRHADGSYVAYASRLRPLVNQRPGFRSWAGALPSSLRWFNLDTHLLAFLDARGLDCDVTTDEDLDREGLAALDGYRCVVLGSHPEYCSTRMRDALQAFLARGGRVAYLGGNGLDWRVSAHPEVPGVIEVRREPGFDPAAPPPGEMYHSTSGEHGGQWSKLGFPEQAVLGIGFVTEGFDVSGAYERTAASRDPRVAFAFAGVGDGPIGAFGLQGGGAAGMETDTVSPATPAHALVIASCTDLVDTYHAPGAWAQLNMPSLNPGIRADMVFFETPAGGAVFGVGSIAWLGSLSHRGYDNDVARITENVLRRFADPAPFPPPPERHS